MVNPSLNEVSPDYVVYPGEILEETLEVRGMKKSAFAKRCGMSDKTISQIINGKAPVTPETAIQFERVLGVSASLWNNLESNFRLYNARAEERKKLVRQVLGQKSFRSKNWLKKDYLKNQLMMLMLWKNFYTFLPLVQQRHGKTDLMKCLLHSVNPILSKVRLRPLLRG